MEYQAINEENLILMLKVQKEWLEIYVKHMLYQVGTTPSPIVF